MEELNEQEPLQEEEELTHTDKMVGVFTEPRETFSKISKFPLKTLDWFLPMLLVSIVSVVSFVLLMMNENVKYDFNEKARIEIQKNIDKELEKGTITEEQTEFAVEMGLKWAIIANYVTKFLGLWFIIFFSALIYWLIIKFGFKDQGGYKTVLVVLGLSSYILVLQSILTIIFAYLTQNYLNSPNLAEILGMNPRVFPDFLLSLIDIILIWYFIVSSIGLSVLFKASSVAKYYILTFGVWIGLSVIIFLMT